MNLPPSFSPRVKLFQMTGHDRMRMERLVEKAAKSPHKHVRMTITHEGKEYRVVVYQARDVARIYEERSAAPAH